MEQNEDDDDDYSVDVSSVQGVDLNNFESGLNQELQPQSSITIPRQLGDKSLFITPRTEGGMRDVPNVECSKINGDIFKGTINCTEATVVDVCIFYSMQCVIALPGCRDSGNDIFVPQIVVHCRSVSLFFMSFINFVSKRFQKR